MLPPFLCCRWRAQARNFEPQRLTGRGRARPMHLRRRLQLARVQMLRWPRLAQHKMVDHLSAPTARQQQSDSPVMHPMYWVLTQGLLLNPHQLNVWSNTVQRAAHGEARN